MKQEWSPNWKSSIQPRKQRKFRHNAPLHVRHRFVSANLSPVLRDEFGRRSMPIRKGDEVEVMRGSFKKFKGVVERVDVKKGEIYVEGVKIKKVDGSEVLKALEPSNLRITKMQLDDKRRQRALERSPRKGAKKPETPKKKETIKKLANKETGKEERPAREKASGMKEEKPAGKREIKKEKKPPKKGLKDGMEGPLKDELKGM